MNAKKLGVIDNPEKGDAVLARMLKTPPQPKAKPKAKKATKKKPVK